MSYSVTIFLNSGFNPVNIPDTPDLLRACATVTTVPDVSILQNRFLTSVRIKANFSEVQDCDYCEVGDFYYFVTGVKMLSLSTSELSLVPDFLTSAGGIKSTGTSFDILDGITSRQTVSKSSDTWGSYTDDDPLTAPQRPLNIFTEWLGPDATSDETVMISSTLDLVKQGQQTEGITYTDSETGETVTVPKTYSITSEDATKVALPSEIPDTGTTIPTGGTLTDGSKYYLGSATDGTYAANGVAKARSLGIESAILDQWAVPSSYMSSTTTAAGDITTLSGVAGNLQSSLPSVYKEDVKNLRVLYGQYNSYGIITAAGNSMEARPEEIVTTESTTEGPDIGYISDPRPDGKPYFRFKVMNNNSEFWRNCVAGETWHKVPYIYQGGSGNSLTRLNFDNSRRLISQHKEQTLNDSEISQFQNTVGFIQNAIGAITGAGNYAARSSAQAPITGATAVGIGAQAVSGIVNAGISYEFTKAALNNQRDYYIANYNVEKANELSQLYQDTTVYTPTVNFPYNSSIIRDVKGNGILVYRYEYDARDITRIDRLLTMYGYKESEPLTLENFYRRPKFDYVECSSVTITGLPRWWCTGIEDQLRNGIRIWHVKPDSQVYIDGNEEETTTA